MALAFEHDMYLHLGFLLQALNHPDGGIVAVDAVGRGSIKKVPIFALIAVFVQDCCHF
jgi:hypothetical protein